jgi:hypothetical protein
MITLVFGYGSILKDHRPCLVKTNQGFSNIDFGLKCHPERSEGSGCALHQLPHSYSCFTSFSMTSNFGNALRNQPPINPTSAHMMPIPAEVLARDLAGLFSV